MNRKIGIIALAILAFTSCGYKRVASSHQQAEDAQSFLPSHVQLISTTPIKDQGSSSLCWAYGMLATIESEHIMKGDSIRLYCPNDAARESLGVLFLQGKQAHQHEGHEFYADTLYQ